MILTHGAGSNRDAPILRTFEAAFATVGVEVLRCDLAFRQARPHGPPRRGDAEKDRALLLEQASGLRAKFGGPIWLGGHSYGGRQATMLAAEEPEVADGLLLLSYPLHPPRRPDQMRTQHFPRLRTPSIFVHGAKDEFATTKEMEVALGLIPARVELVDIAGAGHSLTLTADKAREIAAAALSFWRAL